MGAIFRHAEEYETVRRLAEMLTTAKEDYKATESYALFSTIVCWVIQRARTPETQNNAGDAQARAVGKALNDVLIQDKPWCVQQFPQMPALEFFILIRDAVAHGDARSVTPLNNGELLVGQAFRIKGQILDLRRADMRRLGCQLARVFCDTMAMAEEEGDLRQMAKRIKSLEDVEA